MNLTIEQMRKIVNEAPDWANKFNPETKVYSKTVNVVFLGASYATHVIHSQAGFLNGLVDLKDLRAAIADHDRTDYVSDIRNHISPMTIVQGD